MCLVNDKILNPMKHYIIFKKRKTVQYIYLFNSSVSQYDYVKTKDDLKMQFELNASWTASCDELCSSEGNMQGHIHAR